MHSKQQSQNPHSRLMSRAATATLVTAIVFTLAVMSSQLVRAQTFTVLHSFTGGADGSYPTGNLTMDAAGNLYGTTQEGGTGEYGLGNGVVFKASHLGSRWVTAPLYRFAGSQNNDGRLPGGGVIIGPDGSLYGTTYAGGNGQSCDHNGCGSVYRLQPPAAVCKTAICFWAETVLYRFNGGSDGMGPTGQLVFDTSGNLYGTTVRGGIGTLNDCGTVFKLAPSPEGWTKSTIYSFGDYDDGCHPVGRLVFDGNGNLYGATQNGGTGESGTVFKLAPSAEGWTKSIIHNFQFGSYDPGGGAPETGLIFDDLGNLYGTTTAEGSGGGGTVFELTPFNDSWIYTVLYSFDARELGESGPWSELVMGATGSIYGTTWGYPDNYGTVFKLTPSGSGWTYTLLHDFTGGFDNSYPLGGVALDRNGNIYGTASAPAAGCGGDGCGVIVQITP
jgi:uncharacterized repeat protein (TIGR03803 family)